MSEPALAPAGIIRTPGIDDKFEAIEESLDAQNFRNHFLEGREQTPAETEWQARLLRQVADECNRRLEGRVRLTGCHPERMGFGARIYGVDTEGRDYVVDFRWDDEDRMSGARLDDERRVRESIDLIVTAVLAKRAEYLHRMVGTATA